MGKENMDNQPEEKAGKSPDSKVPADERYPVEDRVMKDAAWFMGKELLPLLGVKGTFKRAAPTEAVFLEISDLMADFNYEMEDGTWKHLEFESDSISVEDLRRFRACEAILSYRYMVEVSTYVLCTSKVKVLRNRLRQGFNTYRVKTVRMKDYNADKIIRRIEKKQEKGRLSREELLKILLAPLMDGETTQFERIRKGFKILQKEYGKIDDRELIHMQSVLYVLMMKFLTVEEIKKMKEMISMTWFGQMLMEDGIERGIEQGMERGMERGEFKTLQELVADGILTVTEAAARKKMTETEFTKKLKELQLS